MRSGAEVLQTYVGELSNSTLGYMRRTCTNPERRAVFEREYSARIADGRKRVFHGPKPSFEIAQRLIARRNDIQRNEVK